MLRAARPPRARLRRHAPFGLYLLALGSLIGATGGPVAAVPVPTARATVMLAVDVSLSMCATDIPPTRLEAAEAAALSFVRQQGPATQIGVVTFASYAMLVQPPTTNHQALEAAISDLETGLGTAIGSGILTSLEAIDDQQLPPTPAPATVRPKVEQTYAPEIIVLLTDGVATTGVPPLEAAQQAAARGVRVYPIGFGTPEGAFAECDQAAHRNSPLFNWQPQPSSGYHEGVDEATLMQIADMTGGTYYAATSAGELQSVLADLPTVEITRMEWIEVSVAFAAVGAALALAALVLGMRWNWWG